MNGLLMICKDPDCPCEDICCQECENNNCENQCENYQYKKRIYSDIEFLVKELTEIGLRKKLWNSRASLLSSPQEVVSYEEQEMGWQNLYS